MGKFKDAVNAAHGGIAAAKGIPSPRNLLGLETDLSGLLEQMGKKLDGFFSVVDEAKALANTVPDCPQKETYLAKMDTILNAVGALERANAALVKAPMLFIGHKDVYSTIKAGMEPRLRQSLEKLEKEAAMTSPMLEAMEAMEREKSEVVGPVVEVVSSEPKGE